MGLGRPIEERMRVMRKNGIVVPESFRGLALRGEGIGIGMLKRDF